MDYKSETNGKIINFVNELIDSTIKSVLSARINENLTAVVTESKGVNTDSKSTTTIVKVTENEVKKTKINDVYSEGIKEKEKAISNEISKMNKIITNEKTIQHVNNEIQKQAAKSKRMEIGNFVLNVIDKKRFDMKRDLKKKHIYNELNDGSELFKPDKRIIASKTQIDNEKFVKCLENSTSNASYSNNNTGNKITEKQKRKNDLVKQNKTNNRSVIKVKLKQRNEKND